MVQYHAGSMVCHLAMPMVRLSEKLYVADGKLPGDHDGSTLGSTYGSINGMSLGDIDESTVRVKTEVAGGRLPGDHDVSSIISTPDRINDLLHGYANGEHSGVERWKTIGRS